MENGELKKVAKFQVPSSKWRIENEYNGKLPIHQYTNTLINQY